ncbi:carboxymuconolactone decarboxylase family protein [Rhizobium sp. MC63]|uniref:Carboxymuconolactone decarboxylase family protein n=1 Tax=Rhizobium mulingense TaxID=3031128 RepID=A0ACC6N3A9_9HYPH|nr:MULTISPECIES: carboxymuconolactone decarboxylase family protein [unclassified Rhizobium]MDF0698554.1 carboxymuconolactone decarboxylase family protein [Rhizobium sp. MC63]MEA3520150.1 carboxymuconolactone decarboxylase family protein [Rhizobium sp. MJ31]
MSTVKLLAAATLTLATVASSPTFSQQSSTMIRSSSVSSDDIRSVSPALGRYEKEDVVEGLWTRPQLSVRDRSVVTVAILVARSQTGNLSHYMNLALDNGVTPKELSEIITHLAFYAGWTNATSALAVAQNIFAERNIGADQLPEASPDLMQLNQEGEAVRRRAVQGLLGDASPRLADFTTDPLFKDVWLRPDLAPRDRSLVTITSLMANGQVAQLAGHLNRALDNGLTPDQAGEVVTQIAFYAGWPNAFSAGPVVAEVLKKRQQ